MGRKKTGKIDRKLKIQLTPAAIAETAKDMDNFHANKEERNRERERMIGRERKLPPGMAAIKPPSRHAYYIDVGKMIQFELSPRRRAER